MATYLITGASRGIGLELTKQLLELPASQVSKVFAVARNIESDAIKHLVKDYPDRVYLVSASIDDNASIQKAAETIKTELSGHGLDVLVNNAGIAGTTSGSIKDMDLDQLTQILNVNVIGTQRVTAAFMSLLEQGTQKKIINMSVDRNRSGVLGELTRRLGLPDLAPLPLPLALLQCLPTHTSSRRLRLICLL